MADALHGQKLSDRVIGQMAGQVLTRHSPPLPFLSISVAMASVPKDLIQRKPRPIRRCWPNRAGPLLVAPAGNGL